MLLKNGSNNEDVKKIQRLLGLKDDGNFGDKTEIAVKKWQKENALFPEGEWALAKLKEIPNLTLKYVVTNQSLYV